MFDGDCAVFVDVTSTRFNLRESVVSLNREAIERDLRRFVSSKVVQEICRSVRDFHSGELVFEGIPQASIKRIYGVVISPQGLPRLVALNKILKTATDGKTEDIDGWDYLDLSEIESLPEIYKGNLDFPRLIREKLQDEFASYRPLNSFHFFKRRSLLRPTKTRDELLGEPWIREVVDCARGWGFLETPRMVVATLYE